MQKEFTGSVPVFEIVIKLCPVKSQNKNMTVLTESTCTNIHKIPYRPRGNLPNIEPKKIYSL